MIKSESLLQISSLSISFRDEFKDNVAVDSISFSINKGETLAVIGESGSGKSVTALSLTKLLPPPPACMVSGEVFLEGKNLLNCTEKELQHIRGKDIAYIFQEPATSLNPVFTIGFQIAEAIRLHRPEVTDVTSEIIKVLDLV